VITLHYIQQGRALCDLVGEPKDWPEGHMWVLDWKEVTCAGCLAKRAEHERANSPDLLSLDVSPSQPRPVVGAKRRSPAYDDTCQMPFGKHKGELLREVPASYLHWLWKNRPISDRRLENYIFNSLDALRKEHPDGIWD
jgi:hypothetical protein